MTWKAKFVGGLADGEVKDMVDPIPDLVDAANLDSWMHLGKGWYLVSAVDYENKEVFYEPTSLVLFPDAVKVAEGLYARPLEENGDRDGIEGG